MCWSIVRYDTDAGGEATYHDGHKIAFSLGPKWIWTVKCGILAIGKTSAKIGIYSVILNVPIKNVQERDNCNIEKKNKNNDFLCQLYSLRLNLFWLRPCIFDFFVCEYMSRLWTGKSETFRMLRKHQTLWPETLAS